MGPRPAQAEQEFTMTRDHRHAARMLTEGHVPGFPIEAEIINIDVAGDEVRQLHVSEVLSGYVFEADSWFNDLVDTVKKLPDYAKPNEVLTGGLMAGPFTHTDKDRSQTLKPGLRTLDSQLGAARGKIDRLLEIGAPVVYNMGPDDMRTATDLAVDRVRQILKLGKEGDQADLSVDTTNQIKGSPIYPEHLQFYKRVAMPYMIHAGRELRTSKQMEGLGLGHQPEDEYYTLIEAHKRVSEGKKLTTRDRKILDLDAFNQRDFRITRDAKVVTKTDGKETTDDVMSYLGFSPTPQYQDFMKPVVVDTETRMANGIAVSEGRFQQHYHEFLALNMGDTWLTSNGSGIDARKYVDADSSIKTVRADLAGRLVGTRRRAHPPTAHIIGRTDEGSTTFSLLNDALMEKSHSLPRTEVLMTCDHQVGSITARADVLAQEVAYFRDRRIGKTSDRWAIQFAGDMSHGRNYPDFPSESQSTMLMAMDSQLRFNQDLWELAMRDMPRDTWDKMDSILIQPGNHEWNSGTEKFSAHGYSFVNDHVNTFRMLLAEAGLSREEVSEKIFTHDAVSTSSGDVAKAFTGIADYGDYRTLNQHFLLARGGKGSGGADPVYQAEAYIRGGAHIMKDIDLLGVGHWHHGACACFGNKASWIAPAKAGLSGYELWRGYAPGMGSMILGLGGGMPVTLEYISERQLRTHTPIEGGFGVEALKQAGYNNDRDYRPMHSSMRDSRQPKSALMKAIRALEYKHGERWATQGPIMDGKHLPPNIQQTKENGKFGLPYFEPLN